MPGKTGSPGKWPENQGDCGSVVTWAVIASSVCCTVRDEYHMVKFVACLKVMFFDRVEAPALQTRIRGVSHN
jgi:hypothetical protein